MNFKKTTTLIFLLGGMLFAQNSLPTDGLKHHFTFDDPGNLEAAVIGNDLSRDALEGVTQLFNSVNGPETGNGAVEVGLGSFYRLDLDFEPNGPDTAQRINQFSIVVDFYLPQTGVWYGIHAATNDGNPTESDWESFIRPEGRVGVGSTGYSYYRTPELEWHRLVISSDLGNSYKYFLDGQLAQDGGEQIIDGRFSLPSVDGANQILLFGDNDGEDANIYIAELGIYDRTLSEEEIWNLGGYGHTIATETPAGLWTFDNTDDLTEPFYGKALELVGTHASVPGPESIDGAISIGVGSHYVVNHNMVENGGGEMVNEYTMAIDFKIDELGKWYSFMQTDPTNSNDAELFINPEGKIGVNDLGYSDSSIVAGDWYRLIIVSDSGNHVKLYLDSDSLMDGGFQDLDGRFSFNPRSQENKLLLFADNDGEDNTIEIANVTIYNRAITKDEIIGLGGFEHGAPNTEITGSLNAVYFNGNDITNKYGKVTKTNDDFNFGDGDFTIEVWVKPDISYASDPSLISDKAWTSGGNPGWIISIRGDDWKFNAADESRNRYDINGPKINDGNWHHLAVIANQDSGMKLITDDLETIWATQDGAFFNVGNIDNPDMPICIAQDGTEKYPDGPPAPAQIDEIRIWKGVAIEPEVIFAYRHKNIDDNHPYRSALVGYWKFNEGTGNTVADLSGKGHNMELIGNPKWEISYAAMGNEIVQTMQDVKGVWGALTNSNSGGAIVQSSFPIPNALPKQIIDENGYYGIQAKEDNPYLVFGHNNESNATTAGSPSGVEARLSRVWYFNMTEVSIGTPSVTFDLSDLGGSGNAGNAANYVLLTSSTQNGSYVEVSAGISVSDDQITFNGFDIIDGYYTLGSKSLSASPLGGLVVGVESNELLPETFKLSQNYPNPFNPSTKISFALPVNAKVQLKVYNILGEAVETLLNENLDAGYHEIEWNSLTKNLSSGMYIYSIYVQGVDGKEFNKSHKMMLLK